MISVLLVAWTGTMPVHLWPYRDVDLGRVYEAPNGSGAMVLVSTAYPYGDTLDAWFSPRVDALAGDAVEVQRLDVQEVADDALRESVQLAAQYAPLMIARAVAYETVAGNQLIVVLTPGDTASADAEVYVADRLHARDVWSGGQWVTPAALPDRDPNLDCRLEQQPSVVWTLERVCNADTRCHLSPTTDMILLEQTVCREPR